MGKCTPRREQLPAADFDAAVDAGVRETAGRTPPLVRTAMLSGPIKIGELELRPFSLGHLMLLEEIKHPFLNAEDEAEMEIRDVATALLIFAKPSVALEAHRAGNLQDAAFELALQVHVDQLRDVGETLRLMIMGGLRTIPGFDPEAQLVESETADPLGK